MRHNSAAEQGNQCVRHRLTSYVESNTRSVRSLPHDDGLCAYKRSARVYDKAIHLPTIRDLFRRFVSQY